METKHVLALVGAYIMAVAGILIARELINGLVPATSVDDQMHKLGGGY